MWLFLGGQPLRGAAGLRMKLYDERVLLDVMMGHRGAPTVRGCVMEGEETPMFLGGPPLRGAARL